MYIFEVVNLPKGLSYDERGQYLRTIEQTYLNKFPKAQLYNSIKASAK